ncbi:MAG: hypothetical protein DRH20_16370, partial [Deltaproteobacteria bacterium]
MRGDAGPNRFRAEVAALPWINGLSKRPRRHQRDSDLSRIIDAVQNEMGTVVKRLIGWIERGSGIMSWVGAFAAGITLVTILFVVLYEIMMRRFFNAPTTWSIELVTFLMVWFSLLTLAMCQRLGRHVRVDLLISRFGARTALLWNFVTLTLTLVFTIILLYFSWLDFWESFQSGETSASIWAPVIWPMKLAMPIGAFLLCFQMISDLLSNARRVFSVTRPDGMQTGKEDVGLWDKAFLQALFWFVVLMAVSSWLLVTHPALGVVVFL